MLAVDPYKPCNFCSKTAGLASLGVQPCHMPAVYLLSCRLLLEITAMRYGCVNHTTFSTCAADQSNWCTWHEEAGRCGMYYDDADFVHLMMWSGTKVACAGVSGSDPGSSKQAWQPSRLQRITNVQYNRL
jgi:hypothetical protein